MRLLLPLLLITLATSAQTVPQSSLAKTLAGEWYNLSVRIKLSGGQTMEADSTNWEAKLQIKPIHTFFMPDGSYHSEYRNLADSIVRRPTGTWNIRGDTLTMQESGQGSKPMRLHLAIDNGVATFTGLIDFDGEGINNDEYYGKQRKKATNL